VEAEHRRKFAARNILLALSCGVSEHSEEWRDADPASEEDGLPGSIVMEAQRAHRPFNPHWAADRQGGYGLLENCISYSRRDEKFFVERGACDGEGVSQSV
jgi:hypothetical protein